MDYIQTNKSGSAEAAGMVARGNLIFGGGDISEHELTIGNAKIVEIRLICGRKIFERLEQFTGGNRVMRARLYSVILQAAADALDGSGDDQRPIGEIVAKQIRKTFIDRTI